MARWPCSVCHLASFLCRSLQQEKRKKGKEQKERDNKGKKVKEKERNGKGKGNIEEKIRVCCHSGCKYNPRLNSEIKTKRSLYHRPQQCYLAEEKRQDIQKSIRDSAAACPTAADTAVVFKSPNTCEALHAPHGTVASCTPTAIAAATTYTALAARTDVLVLLLYGFFCLCVWIRDTTRYAKKQHLGPATTVRIHSICGMCNSTCTQR